MNGLITNKNIEYKEGKEKRNWKNAIEVNLNE